jgi:hypothetical protein
MASENNPHQLPLRFVDIKRDIAAAYPDFEKKATTAWREILEELSKTTEDIKKAGSEYIPQVNFVDLDNLTSEEIASIKTKGSLVIKDVVDDSEVTSWKAFLDDFVKKNPVEGFPEADKQFFQLYWTKPQVAARAHPNVLKASAWLNNLYQFKDGQILPGVDLSTPLTYADRFRIRHPGGHWDAHPPHVDGGSIERWEDKTFRVCFEDIFNGNWKKHDPYDITGRVNAKSSLYGRANQASIFRSFQGWLAMCDIAPHQGTLQVFPNVILSNAYNMIRPFFRSTLPEGSPGALNAENWVFDIETPDFPGILPNGPGFYGPRPTHARHPHLRLDDTMTSMPPVSPGDMVFWHCDVIHAVEPEHLGKGDSAVMYIPSVPLTPQNLEYVERQLKAFKDLKSPADYGNPRDEKNFVGTGTPEDIVGQSARRAMGLAF